MWIVSQKRKADYLAKEKACCRRFHKRESLTQAASKKRKFNVERFPREGT